MDWGAYSGALVAGGVGGGLFAAVTVLWTWWIDRREKNAQELLAQAMEIQSLKEAWILEGENYHIRRLSDHKGLPTEDPKNGGLWLRQVEIRAVLDQEKWNAPENQYYGFIGKRRAWIVRDAAEGGELSYQKNITRTFLSPHPALISSKGMEELHAWVERVASSKERWISGGLSCPGIAMLNPLLLAVAGDDRIKVFGNRLTPRAKNFLQSYRRDNGVTLK